MRYSRAQEKHWIERNWPPRSDLKPSDPSAVHESLVDIEKIIFPPLHMKQFIKELSTEGYCFILVFPGQSIEKKNQGWCI